MAVTRIKAQHGGKAMQNALAYIENERKTDMAQHTGWFENYGESAFPIDAETVNAISYSENSEKTILDDGTGIRERLVSGYRCDPTMAALQFTDCMNRYHEHHDEHLKPQTARRIFRAKLDENGTPVLDERGNMIYDENAPVWKDAAGKCRYETYKKQTQARTSYMWVMSFPPERVCGYKIDPRLVHQIGREFCERIGGGAFPAVIATHMDREHPHNHIVMCAYAADGSHKYRDCKDTLMLARQISDDLSQKYHLPVIAELSQEKGSSIDWTEWKNRQERTSWKLTLQGDIEDAMRVSHDLGEFVSAMHTYGYRIRETEHHFTFQFPDEDGGMKCRDTRLGKEFEKDQIAAALTKSGKRDMPPQNGRRKDGLERKLHLPESVYSKKSYRIHIRRFTLDGRRRSDLEMLLLLAIQIIRFLKDRFHDVAAENGRYRDKTVNRDYLWKEKKMLAALSTLREMGIKTDAELSGRKLDMGEKLSVAKSRLGKAAYSITYAEHICDLLMTIRELQREAKKIPDFHMDDLGVMRRGEGEVRVAKAKTFPIAPGQKKMLYHWLQRHSDTYRLGCPYDLLSAQEANQVIEYLRNEGSLLSSEKDRPDILHRRGEYSPKDAPISAEATAQEQTEREKKELAVFNPFLLTVPAEYQETILKLRRTVGELADLGIMPENYEQEEARIQSETSAHEALIEQTHALSKEYRKLCQLQRDLRLARDDTFLLGNRYQQVMREEELKRSSHQQGLPVSAPARPDAAIPKSQNSNFVPAPAQNTQGTTRLTTPQRATFFPDMTPAISH